MSRKGKIKARAIRMSNNEQYLLAFVMIGLLIGLILFLVIFEPDF